MKLLETQAVRITDSGMSIVSPPPVDKEGNLQEGWLQGEEGQTAVNTFHASHEAEIEVADAEAVERSNSVAQQKRAALEALGMDAAAIALFV